MSRIFDNFFSEQITAYVSHNDTSITMSSVPSDSEGYLVLEPNISNKREVIYYHSTNGIDTIYVAANGRGLRGSANVGVGTEHNTGAIVELNLTAQQLAELEEVKNTLSQGAIRTGATALGIIINGWKGLIGNRDVQTADESKTLNDNKITYIEIKPNDDETSIVGEIIYTEFATEDESNWTQGYKKIAIVRTAGGLISNISGIEDRREFGNIPNYEFLKSISTTTTSGLSNSINTNTRDVELEVNVDDSTIEITGNELQLKNNGITSAKISSGQVVKGLSVLGESILHDNVTITAGTGISLTQTGPNISISGDLIANLQVKLNIDYITPTDFQTSFTLGQSVSNSQSIRVRLNGLFMRESVDWTVTGNLLTWTGIDLDTLDELSIEWFTSTNTTLVYEWIEDVFTPTNGQIIFELSATPSDIDSIAFIVNGITYTQGDDWTILGTTITWLDNEFVIGVQDEIKIKYVTN